MVTILTNQKCENCECFPDVPKMQGTGHIDQNEIEYEIKCNCECHTVFNFIDAVFKPTDTQLREIIKSTSNDLNSGSVYRPKLTELRSEIDKIKAYYKQIELNKWLEEVNKNE